MIARKPKSISHAKDTNKLLALMGGLLRKECWKIAFSYGGELQLHFGAQKACSLPKLAEEKEGEWILNTCSTRWLVSTFMPQQMMLVFGPGNQWTYKRSDLPMS